MRRFPLRRNTPGSCPWADDEDHRNNTLYLQSVTRAHHGDYQCRATNTLGQGLSSSNQNVEILFAPDRPVLSLDPVATEGEVITINCTVESWPLPSSLILSWSSSDASMSRTLHQVSNTASLTKSLNVTSESTGRYTCIARNSQGSNQTEAGVGGSL
ncbi:hypothetical protein CRUP_003932 [Coryphaenoides rupestris]|nr:hypothetical protein CRUP_003932 [Coryphaenoides rupestris]